MMKLAVVLVVVVAGCQCADLNVEWMRFKLKHQKQYKDAQEEQMRRQIWQDNLAYIEKHNAAYRAGKYDFYVGENEYADLSNKEFVQLMNGYRTSEKQGSHLVYSHNDVTDLPDTVDWRDKGYVTPVKNQGQCGSCWAFSTTGSLEGQWFKKYNKLVSLSEQNLVDCSQKQGNHGCEGGLMDNAFKYIKENNGIDTEATYPYRGVDASCKFNAANVGANDTGFVDVKSKDESALQSAVATIGPISVAIDANHMSFQLYSGGVYHNFLCSEVRLDHGVLAVGYGTLNGKAYWLVKNSWGATWGDKGYIYMSRNRHNNCGIATQASYPTV